MMINITETKAYDQRLLEMRMTVQVEERLTVYEEEHGD